MFEIVHLHHLWLVFTCAVYPPNCAAKNESIPHLDLPLIWNSNYFNKRDCCWYKMFTTVPDSSINSWESWFIFNLWKINTNQYYKSDFLECKKMQHVMWTHGITRWRTHNNYCTYLNILEAPREYVLHGLVPSLNWAPFWPLSMRMHLVAMPSPVSYCLLQQVKFHA
jgi:hypothetical protein